MAKKVIRASESKRSKSVKIEGRSDKRYVRRNQEGQFVTVKGNTKINKLLAARMAQGREVNAKPLSNLFPDTWTALSIEAALDAGIRDINESQKRINTHQESIDADKKDTRRLLAKLEKQIAAQ